MSIPARRTFLKSIAGLTSLKLATQIPTTTTVSNILAHGYADSPITRQVTQAVPDGEPLTPFSSDLYITHGMSFGPKWLHESASRARNIYEGSAWNPPKLLQTPEMHRARKFKSRHTAYLHRIRRIQLPLDIQTYARQSRTISATLKSLSQDISI
jgi:hypothetical protein